jgi:hypothetical protein
MEIFASDVINSLGLVLDIVGAVLLWKYGLPEALSREGHTYLALEETNEAEKAKAASYDKWSRAGLGLLIAGFVLQLISNFL